MRKKKNVEHTHRQEQEEVVLVVLVKKQTGKSLLTSALFTYHFVTQKRNQAKYEIISKVERACLTLRFVQFSDSRV